MGSVLSWYNQLFWRVAVTIAFLASLFSNVDNRSRVRALEKQVCDTVSIQIETIPTIEYYQDPAHKAERDRALRDAEATLRRFHCDITEPREK